MNIFKKRPLCMILCIMLVAFSFFTKFDTAISLYVCGVMLLIIPLLFLIKIKINNRGMCIATILMLIISILASAIWSSTFFPKEYYDTKVKISGCVTDTDHTNTSYSALILKADRINSDYLNVSFYISSDKDTLSGINPGDVIEIEGTVCSLDELNSIGTKNYYIANGIGAILTDVSDCNIIGYNPSPLSDFFENIASYICARLKNLTNNQTGSLLSALIIGDRTNLDANTALNFRRIGISHILALSGMHLAILSGALSKLLSLLKFNKKIKAAVISVLTLMYMALTGFSSSVTRAGIMLIIYNLMFLIGSPADRVTSLSISVALIVIIQPHAIFDISLLLSALATFGIICFSEIPRNDDKEKRFIWKAIKRLALSLLATVFAISTTFLLISTSFKSFSVISPFTTLIFSVLIEALIYIGLLTLIIGSAIPIGRLAVVLSDFIIELSEIFSNSKWIQVSTDYTSVKVLLIAYTVFFFAFLIFDVKYKRCVIAVITVLFVSIFVTGLTETVRTESENTTVFYSENNADLMLIRSERSSALIYSGSSSIRSLSSAKELLDNNRLTYLDKLILTGCTYTDKAIIEGIMGSVKTDTVYLPNPRTDYEAEAAVGISEMLRLYGTDMSFYKTEESIFIGAERFILLGKEAHTPDNTSTECVYILGNEGEYCIYATTGYEDNLKPAFMRVAPDCHTVILGGFGEDSTPDFNYRLPSVQTLIYHNSYNINTELLDYYKNKGASTKEIEAPIVIIH